MSDESDGDESGEYDSGSDSRTDSGSSEYDSTDSDDDDAEGGKLAAEEIRKRRERNLEHMRQMAGVITPAASPGEGNAGHPYNDKPNSP